MATLREQPGIDITSDGTFVDIQVDASEIASSILTAVKTVDGSGSGLDADTVDGQHASAFLTAGTSFTLADGTVASPSINFTSDTATGMYRAGTGLIGISNSGSLTATFRPNAVRVETGRVLSVPNGTAGAPSMTFTNSPNTGFYQAGTEVIGFSANGSEVLRLASSGISFNIGTNWINNYEEGTFTPSFSGGSVSPSVTYGSRAGYYVRVGNLVFVWAYIAWTAYSGGSGDLRVNLPIAVMASSASPAGSVLFSGVNVATNSYNSVLRANQGQTHAAMEVTSDSGATVTVQVGDMAASGAGRYSVVYQA